MTKALKALTPLIIVGFIFRFTAFAATDYIPGSKCPDPHDNRLAVVCGTVRSALPKAEGTDFGMTQKGGKGIPGVSIYIYEFAAILNGWYNPTGKNAGALVNLFSSNESVNSALYGGTTDQDGVFSITMRRVGNEQIRYLVFKCSGKIAGLKRIPSYQNMLDQNYVVDCPALNAFEPPNPAKPLNYILGRVPLNTADSNHLSCDMEEGTEDAPLTREVAYGFDAPKVGFNYFLELKEADQRFLTTSNSPLDLRGIGNINGPDRGAFWSHDCLRAYASSSQGRIAELCRNPGSETALEFRERFYYEPNELVQNALPNIPATPTLLFYKEFTPRIDLKEYVQRFNKPAQWLHTEYGNCIGKVFYRQFAEQKTDELVDCEQFKMCNDSITTDKMSGNYRNVQNTSGPAKMLDTPTDFEAAFNSPDIDMTKPVCKHNGSDVTIAQIQPPWSDCYFGETGCGGYAISKEYFNPEFLFFYGTRGSTSQYSYGFEGQNDSYYSQSVNKIKWQSAWEGRGIPQKAGSRAVITNGGLNTNNSLRSGEIISTMGSAEGEPLTNVFSMPYESQSDKIKYMSGIQVQDKDVSQKLCLDSATNPEAKTVTYPTQGLVVRNQLFKGNTSHHPNDTNPLSFIGSYVEPTPSQIMDGTRSATSGIFLTTAAINRIQALRDGSARGGQTFPFYWSGWVESAGHDVFDSMLTASYGNGTVELSWGQAFLSTVGWLFSNDQKAFFDRHSNSNTAIPLGGADPRDDILLDYPVNEMNFETLYRLPTLGEIMAASPTFGAAWPMGDACYPWNPKSEGQQCLSQGDIKTTYQEADFVSRTCRLDMCKSVSAPVSCSCTRAYGGSGGYVAHGDCSTTVDNVSFHDNNSDCNTNEVTAVLRGQNTCIKNRDTGEYDEQCLRDLYRGSIQDAIDSVDDRCPDPTDPNNYLNGTEDASTSVSTPAAAFSLAGPYECASDLKKDSNESSKQQIVGTQAVDLAMDNMSLAENELAKTFIAPFATDIAHVPGAELSSNSSVNPRDERGTRTTGKDTKGTGAAAKEPIMAPFAAPIIFRPDIQYNPVQYWCTSPELGSVGLWTCPLLPVPNPEIVDLNSLNIDGSCSLKPTSGCIDALNAAAGFIPGASQLPSGYQFSPAYVSVMSAAATRGNIPASMLLVYLARARKFYQYSYYWTVESEPTFIAGSAPWYGTLGTCDDTDTSAQGMYDWIRGWFMNDLEAGGADALNEISQGRGTTAHRCNYLDSTYVMAVGMGRNGGGCGMSWDQAKSILMTYTWGNDRQGAYQQDNIMDAMGGVFNACR